MNDQLAWGTWMLVRVNIYTTMLIKRGKMFMVEDGKKVLALFRYERLSDFCYVCGKLDHQDIDRGPYVSLQKDNKRLSDSTEHGCVLKGQTLPRLSLRIWVQDLLALVYSKRTKKRKLRCICEVDIKVII